MTIATTSQPTYVNNTLASKSHTHIVSFNIPQNIAIDGPDYFKRIQIPTKQDLIAKDQELIHTVYKINYPCYLFVYYKLLTSDCDFYIELGSDIYHTVMVGDNLSNTDSCKKTFKYFIRDIDINNTNIGISQIYIPSEYKYKPYKHLFLYNNDAFKAYLPLFIYLPKDYYFYNNIHYIEKIDRYCFYITPITNTPLNTLLVTKYNVTTSRGTYSSYDGNISYNYHLRFYKSYSEAGKIYSS